jgi:hypothetical protein
VHYAIHSINTEHTEIATAVLIKRTVQSSKKADSSICENKGGNFLRLLFSRILDGREIGENITLAKKNHYTVNRE